MAATPDVKLAYEALNAKYVPHTTYFAYYDGDAPLSALTQRLREIFKGLNVNLQQNWAEIVINATADRLQMTGFSVAGNKKAEEALSDLWSVYNLALEADDMHEAALVTGEAYIIAWPNEAEDNDGNSELDIYFNDPRMCHVVYEADNPRQARLGVKWWDDDTGRRRMTLYYRDHIEYYVSKAKAKDISTADAFVPDPEYMPEDAQPGIAQEPVWPENPFETIPIFHFRTSRRRLKSDLNSVIPLQDGVNILFTNMMVASEFAALPQKYIISQAEIEGKLRSAPNTILEFAASDGIGQPTTVGQFSAATLDNFTKPIEQLAGTIGILTNTPKHYFFSQGGDPSGEALIAMEAPLNKKATDRIARFTPAWRDLAEFLCLLLRIPVEAKDITPVYRKPETVQPVTQATTTKTRTESGIPLKTVLRREEGWTPADLDQLEKDKAEEQEAGQAQLANAMVNAQKQFDQGGTGLPEGNEAPGKPAAPDEAKEATDE